MLKACMIFDIDGVIYKKASRLDVVCKCIKAFGLHETFRLMMAMFTHKLSDSDIQKTETILSDLPKDRMDNGSLTDLRSVQIHIVSTYPGPNMIRPVIGKLFPWVPDSQINILPPNGSKQEKYLQIINDALQDGFTEICIFDDKPKHLKALNTNLSSLNTTAFIAPILIGKTKNHENIIQMESLAEIRKLLACLRYFRIDTNKIYELYGIQKPTLDDVCRKIGRKLPKSSQSSCVWAPACQAIGSPTERPWCQQLDRVIHRGK